MTTKLYKLQDEHGSPWHVGPGDPAHGLCDKLNKLGWETLYLSTRILITGVVDRADLEQRLAALHELCRFAEGVSDPDLDDLLLAAFDAFLQLDYLFGGTSNVSPLQDPETHGDGDPMPGM